MAHSHAPGGHDHGTRRAANRKRLALTLALVVLYMGAEVVGGLLTNSLALLADAGHMFSDAAALGLALFAIWFARRPASSSHTFGYYRTEILAALVNGASLVAISIYIFVEAIQRFRSPPEVEGGMMMVIAAGGLLVNLGGLFILRGGREESLNVRGAWLHVFTDMLGSAQALVAGGLIWLFGWNWADPVASVLIGLLVVYSSWSLLKESVAVLMQRAPGHIDVDELRGALLALEGVLDVDDLHVWTVTSGMESLSAHVTVESGRDHLDMLRRVRRLVHDQFGIDHITVQVEPEDFEEHRGEF
jgi:cobalt-zinc-cadmium efflux system protein